MSELHTAFRWCGEPSFETLPSLTSSCNFLSAAGPLTYSGFFFLTPRLASLCSNVATLSLSDLDRFLARTGQYQRMRSLVKSLARVTKAPVHEIEASLYALSAGHAGKDEALWGIFTPLCQHSSLPRPVFATAARCPTTALTVF